MLMHLKALLFENNIWGQITGQEDFFLKVSLRYDRFFQLQIYRILQKENIIKWSPIS